ncbi:hypothetical protein Tco_1252638 [Tanacetum coccineum]
MNKIFSFVFDHPPPAIIVLISGDADYHSSLAALRLLQGPAIQQDLVLKDVSEEQNMVKSRAMRIFWDFDSMGLPMNLQHETSSFRTEETKNALHSRPRFQ